MANQIKYVKAKQYAGEKFNSNYAFTVMTSKLHVITEESTWEAMWVPICKFISLLMDGQEGKDKIKTF